MNGRLRLPRVMYVVHQWCVRSAWWLTYNLCSGFPHPQATVVACSRGSALVALAELRPEVCGRGGFSSVVRCIYMSRLHNQSMAKFALVALEELRPEVCGSQNP
jgi:hypothetical protein